MKKYKIIALKILWKLCKTLQLRLYETKFELKAERGESVGTQIGH